MKAENFGEYIKEQRLSKNLTIRQLELYSGVSNSYLSQLENGKRGIPSPAIIKKLAAGLKIPNQKLLKQAGYVELLNIEEDKYNPLEEINELLKKYDIDQSGFFDIEKWKAMGPDEIKELESYFEYITSKAKKKEQQND